MSDVVRTVNVDVLGYDREVRRNMLHRDMQRCSFPSLRSSNGVAIDKGGGRCGGALAARRDVSWRSGCRLTVRSVMDLPCVASYHVAPRHAEMLADRDA